ncbi:MAG: hypothetical protein KJ069_16640 [Anaerolineae bacterium]|nr:hypothetical protein [Anaerolineae bacterium]
MYVGFREGTQIPYTEDFKYPLAQVIAILEVKKNLYTDTLDSAYQNLISAKKLSLKGLKDTETSRKQFRDAYSSLVGEDPFSYENLDEIPVWKKQIRSALYEESLIPIRIVVGYHGFASENSLREAFVK